MTENLVFLGSGASVPFGLPTMRELVRSFEISLEGNVKGDSDRMVLSYYREIKQNLERVHDTITVRIFLEYSPSLSSAVQQEPLYGMIPNCTNSDKFVQI